MTHAHQPKEYPMKTCGKCREVKPVSEFYWDPRNRDGLRGSCKACLLAYRAENRERIAAYHAVYKAEHRAEHRADSAAYNAKHRDRIAARNAARHAAHPERELTKRARRRGATIIEVVDPRVLFERAMGFCHICMTPVDPDRWDVDHIVPISAGGEHSYANTAVSHPSCNYSKGAATNRKAVA